MTDRFKIIHSPFPPMTGKYGADMSKEPKIEELEIEADNGQVERVLNLIYDHQLVYRDSPLGILLPLSDYFGLVAHLWKWNPIMTGRIDDIKFDGVPVYPTTAKVTSIMLRPYEATSAAYHEAKKAPCGDHEAKENKNNG